MRPKDATDELRGDRLVVAFGELARQGLELVLLVERETAIAACVEDRLYDVRVDGSAFARSIQTASLFLPL